MARKKKNQTIVTYFNQQLALLDECAVILTSRCQQDCGPTLQVVLAAWQRQCVLSLWSSELTPGSQAEQQSGCHILQMWKQKPGVQSVACTLQPAVLTVPSALPTHPRPHNPEEAHCSSYRPWTEFSVRNLGLELRKPVL